MGSKVFVHLTHLKLPQISQTYLKIFDLSGHLIKINKLIINNDFEVFFIIFPREVAVGIFHNLSKNALGKK